MRTTQNVLGRLPAGGDRLGCGPGVCAVDAHIAALAIDNQAVGHSNDNAFSRFPGLRWSNPLR